MGDLFGIFVLALVAMVNPTLLAAVTIMLLLPNPKRLMLGYLLGAYTTSITLGLLIVFSLNDSAGVETAQQTLSPAQDLVVGGLFALVAVVLASGRDEPLRERRRRRKEEKAVEEEPKQPWAERMLGRGSARVTFAVGVLLTFPGVSYLTALDRMAGLDTTAALTALAVIVFCLIQQLLLEIPLLGYAFEPERTERAVAGFRAWLDRSGRRAATIALGALGGLLIVRGLVELIVQ